jgi:hypothetical protein
MNRYLGGNRQLRRVMMVEWEGALYVSKESLVQEDLRSGILVEVVGGLEVWI